MAILSRFYVYVLARPNGKPFYVGKGKRRKKGSLRLVDHEREARRGCKCHRCNVIRKIWRNGGEVQCYMVFNTDDEQEALNYEVELIALYGRRTLCNLTDGGEGWSPSEEIRTKIRAGMQRVHKERSAEESARIRAKTSAARKGKKLTDEHRQKLSAVRKGRIPANIEIFKNSSRGRKRSAEVNARNADWHRGRSPANKGAHMSPEKAARIALTKTGGKTYVITSPDGTVFRGICCLTRFCEEHGVPPNTLHNAVRRNPGKTRSGWHIAYEES